MSPIESNSINSYHITATYCQTFLYLLVVISDIFFLEENRMHFIGEEAMRRHPIYAATFLCLFTGLVSVHQCIAVGVSINSTARLFVDAALTSGGRIPDSLFGIFFEEINHAGAGGLWAELVSNKGFEAGGLHAPSNIGPWSIIGDESLVVVYTEPSSCFESNKIAARIDVLCDVNGPILCPIGGVGIYNRGFWGMSIEMGKSYKLIFYVRSAGSIELVVSLASSNGMELLATTKIKATAADMLNWTKMEALLEANGTNNNARLQFTTSKGGTIWLDQVSLMPADTYKGHGFRSDLVNMLADLKPRFMRFPGGCFVEGEWLRNAFRWKESIGPWEDRPGHFGDVWMYWTDDGLGYFEFLQLAEDLGAFPVWVINNGISHQDQVDTAVISPFVKDALDSIEFARGDVSSRWGSIRAAMGHPKPFNLKYVAIGNEDCGKKNYRGNYLKFYRAISSAYPDIKLITNCDGSSRPLDHPAHLYDFHIYASAKSLFSLFHQFDASSRVGPKAFVSEYAVTGKDAGTGSLLAALAEGAFLLGLEKNSDVVAMASYAPLFVNTNDRRWNPDAIVFNSSLCYGTPSYWVQHFFTESSGATLLNTQLETNSTSLVASAVAWKNSSDGSDHIQIKIVNFADSSIDFKIVLTGVDPSQISSSGSRKTVLTSANVMDENSFEDPKKIVPVQYPLEGTWKDKGIKIPPYSFTSLDLLMKFSYMCIEEDNIHLSSM